MSDQQTPQTITFQFTKEQDKTNDSSFQGIVLMDSSKQLLQQHNRIFTDHSIFLHQET